MIIFLLTSCKRTHHEFYFDIKNQKMVCCDNSPIYQLTIDNDSTTVDNFPYEGGMVLVWEGDRSIAPREFSFNNIPALYCFSKGKSAKNFKFKPSCKYYIKKYGGGNPSFKIKVWTDSNGKVYKTTHPSCGLKTLE